MVDVRRHRPDLGGTGQLRCLACSRSAPTGANLDDPEVYDYLNRLGGRLVAFSSEPGQPFEFFAIDDNAINAFAIPGGFVGVNTGLIQLAQNESELASVLSHEISHVTQHHYARMISGQRYDSLAALATVAVAILAARNNPEAATTAVVGAQAGTVQRQLNFTREHEKEADRIGLAILEKSGLKPADFKYAVFHQPNGKFPKRAAQMLVTCMRN